MIQLTIFLCFQDLPTVVISGKMVSKDGGMGTKSVFIMTDEEGATTYCNVEELVKEHYKEIHISPECYI